ncbi:MAG: cupredoxin domain-containing protein [Thermoanaerobaculia bacterium]
MRNRILHLTILGLLCTSLAFSIMANSRPGPRQIVLEARDMAFYLPDNNEPNPMLILRAGEKVRLRLINRDRGFEHDWKVESLKLATRLLPGNGASDQIVLTAPEEPGRHEYVCSLHSKIMRGILEVQ